jgi:outer membrane protein assembly factor BamB
LKIKHLIAKSEEVMKLILGDFMKLFTVLTAFFLLMVSACDHNGKGPDPCGDGEISAADAVWSHGNGDLQNTQRSTAIRHRRCLIGPRQMPNVEWSFSLGGPGTASAPVVGDDGTVYIIAEYPGEPKGTGIRNSGLLAITSAGNLKWFFPMPTQAGGGGTVIYTRSPAIGSDGTIYIAGYDSTLKAIRPDGSLKWSKPIFSSIKSPAIDRFGNIYVGLDTIYSVDPNGDILWKFYSPEIGDLNFCRRIVLSDKRIYCGFLDKGIIAINYQAEQLWFYPFSYENAYHFGILLDEDENLYFKANSSQIYSIDKNANLRWGGQISTPGGLSEPVLRGQYIYFGAFGAVYQLDKLSGSDSQILNTLADGAYVSSDFGPIIDDTGTLFIAGGSDFVTAIANTGEKLWELQLPPAPLAAFDGYAAVGLDSSLFIATWESSTPGVTNYLYKLK